MTDFTTQHTQLLNSLALGMIAHWMFASQYLKTSLVTPDIIKEASLRRERHSIKKDESEIS